MGTDSTPPAGNGQSPKRPDLMTGLVLPVLVAIITTGAIAVLTPAGVWLRELVFPTSADVSGSALVNGQPATGAQLALDGRSAGKTDAQGAFLLEDVGKGKHRVKVQTTTPPAEGDFAFSVPRGTTELKLGGITLNPLLQLGYVLSLRSQIGQIAYEVTLWIRGDTQAMSRIRSVTYRLPAPLSGSVQGRSRAKAFCYRQAGTLAIGDVTVGDPSASADVRLRGALSFTVTAEKPGQDLPPPCPLSPTPPDTTTAKVPYLVGQPYASASSLLQGAGFMVARENVKSNQAAGIVVAQHPRASESASVGSTVSLQVSGGANPHTITVPDVVGQPYESASSLLQATGFVVARENVESNQASGLVVAQHPRGSESAPAGSTVTLQVSKGASTTSVPDVTEQHIDTATATLNASGFKVKVVSRDTSDPSLDGVVISEDPPGGTTAKLGTTVTLSVGRFR